MRCRERDVAKERPVFVALDEVECPVGAHIDDIALGADHASVFLERRIEVLAPVARRVTKVLVEPAGQRVIRPLAAVVPFAERAGGVAGRFERVGDGCFVDIKPFMAGRNAVDAAARMIAAREELGPRRCTNGADEESVERHAVSASESICGVATWRFPEWL